MGGAPLAQATESARLHNGTRSNGATFRRTETSDAAPTIYSWRGERGSFDRGGPLDVPDRSQQRAGLGVVHFHRARSHHVDARRRQAEALGVVHAEDFLQ